jgi:hypothetical protein
MRFQDGAGYRSGHELSMNTLPILNKNLARVNLDGAQRMALLNE